MMARVEISKPRSTRPVQELKKRSNPKVCLPLLGMKEVSCAAIKVLAG